MNRQGCVIALLLGWVVGSIFWDIRDLRRDKRDKHDRSESGIWLCGFINDSPTKILVIDSFAMKMNEDSAVRLVKCDKETKLKDITLDSIRELDEALGISH